MKTPPALLGTALCLLLIGCSGGGNAGNAGDGAGNGNLRPWAIDEAAATGMAEDLLVAGDMFVAELDLAAATALGDQMWAVMRAVPTWVGTNPLYTYQFYDDTDPFTNWGRAYRHTGFDVYAGPIIGPPGFLGPGTYIAATGEQLDAVILRTWDESYWELFILQDNLTLIHATQHFNGLPIVQTYTAN